MSKQIIPLYLKKAIWFAYNKKSGYEGVPITFLEMEIDHIIPERVLINPKEPNEFAKWKEKFNLEDDFHIQGIENLCPSTREFNKMKSDKGLYDKDDAYKGFIVRALIKAKQLKPKIEKLRDESKKQLDGRKTRKIINILNAVKNGDINIKTLILEGLKINYDELKDIEDLEKYNDIFDKYKSVGIRFYNFGESFEIKSAVRYSHSYKIEDIEFWINLLDEFLSKVKDNKIKNNLFYEKAYAMLKANKSWKPIEIELLEYFKSMKKENNLETLNQSSILFGIFYGEFQRERINSSIETVFEIREYLLNNLSEKIENSQTEMRIANLEYSKFIVESGYTPEEYKLILSNDENLDELWVNRYFKGLKRLLGILENVKFFDFNEFFNTFKKFSEIVPIIREHKEFDDIFSKISNLKSKYEGNNSTITDLMRRGIELYDDEKYFQAIKRFNKIKNLSFNPDKLYTCIFSIYYLGECYNKLGFHYASKYYFMVVFHLANEMDVEYNTKQLTYNCGTDRIAMIDYNLNNDIEAIYFTSISIILREFFSLEGYELSMDKNKNAYILIKNALNSFSYSMQKSERLKEIIKEFYQSLDLLDFIEEGIERLKFSYSQEKIKKIDEKTGGFFKDAEKLRKYSWLQLDINWTVKWDNIFIDTSLSEEFIAYLQIYLSTLKDIDIISPTDIELRVIPSSKLDLQKINGNFEIQIPNEKDSDYFHRLFAIIFTIIMDKMIISRDQVMKEVKPLFEVGYFSNFYNEIYKSLVPSDLFYFYNLINSDSNE